MYTRQRGAEQLAADGRVRDRRKHNRSEANLNEGQQDCLLTYIYDEFEQKKYVNYEKVKKHAVLIEHDESICSSLGVEPCDGPDDCWMPSDGWIAGYLDRWRVSSHKTQGKASSRSRPTMQGELDWTDENYAKFPGWRCVTQDESSFIWGAPPYRTLATSDGLGAQVSVEDKWEKRRSTLVLAVRSVHKDKNLEHAILTPFIIPSHSCLPKGKSTASSDAHLPPQAVAHPEWAVAVRLQQACCARCARVSLHIGSTSSRTCGWAGSRRWTRSFFTR